MAHDGADASEAQALLESSDLTGGIDRLMTEIRGVGEKASTPLTLSPGDAGDTRVHPRPVRFRFASTVRDFEAFRKQSIPPSKSLSRKPLCPRMGAA